MARTKTPGSAPFTAKWYEGVAGLRQLRADWYELTPGAHLFARYEWHLAATVHLAGDDHSVRFCRIADAKGRPLAIVPAITGNAEVRPFGKLPTLALGLHEHLVAFDFPLAPGADLSRVGKALLKAFRNHPFHWSVLSWGRVMADSNAAMVARAINHRLTDIAPASVCSTFCTAIAPNPVEGLQIFSVKSNKLRRTIAQHTRRLARHGPIQLRMAREEGDIDGFFKEFLRIEASGWKGEKGTRTAISLVPDAKAFYGALLAESNADFETDIALLYCGDKAVAGQFLLRAARWEHVYKIGFDQAFAECSPGQILLQLTLERAGSSSTIDRVSLVTGLDWMKVWMPIQEPTLQINIFRHMWRPFVAHLGRYVLNRYRSE